MGRKAFDSEDSDEESTPEFKKRKVGNDTSLKLGSLSADLALTLETVQETKRALEELTEVNSLTTLPLSVLSLVKDAFKCKVCLKVPIFPPVIATRCCNTLLGCKECINSWYSGDDALDKNCPHCREPRGYAQTFQLKGIDDFLTGFSKIIPDLNNNAE